MLKTPKLYQETSLYNKTKTVQAGIQLLADSITSVVNGTETYTDPTGRVVTNTLGSLIRQVAGNVLIVATRNANNNAEGGAALITSLINVATEGVKIAAPKVDIEGAALFTSGRLSQSSLNNAYDAKGAGVAAAANKADKSAAVQEEQLIYISKPNETITQSKIESWVDDITGDQNTWTIKRPQYDSLYPILFVAKQTKTVSGTVTCSTPMIDDTTTVIDGGHIITNTIDASKINTNTITVASLNDGSSYAKKTDVPTKVADLSDSSNYAKTTAIPTNVSQLRNDSGYQTSSEVTTAITSGIVNKADKADAVLEEQLIYKSMETGISSIDPADSWITNKTGNQNTWTIKRPKYNSSYPVLFIAKQKKTVSGSVSCSTPMIDDTTTVIDGGNIITNTIDASKINAAGLTIGYSQINDTPSIPSKISDLQNDALYQTASDMNNAISTAKSEAISSANASTDTKLNNYSTTTQMNNAISDAKSEAIDSSNSSTNTKLNNYSTTTQMNNAISSAKSEAISSSNSSTDTKLNNYSTTTQMNNAISNAKSEAISSSNSSTDTKLNNYSTTTQMNNAISDAVDDVNDAITDESNKRKAKYGTCSTLATSSSKAVSCSNFELVAGNELTVLFSYANTVSGALTLNVNNTGAKNIYVSGSVVGSSNALYWGAGAYITFRYNGTGFIIIGEPRTWYGACNTDASSVSKTDTTAISGIVICKGTIINLQMTNANTASRPTLNIQNTGAKSIYSNNSTLDSSSNETYSWSANSTVSFVFDGTYYRYDSNAASKSLNAAKTATNYIQADSSGIKVHDAEDATNYFHIVANSFDIVLDNISRISAIVSSGNSNIRIGENNSPHVIVGTSDMSVYTNSNDKIASFGDYILLGKTSTGHVRIDYHSFEMYDVDNSKYVHLSDLRDSTGVATIVEVMRVSVSGTTCTCKFTDSVSSITVTKIEVEDDSSWSNVSYTNLTKNTSAKTISFRSSAVTDGDLVRITYTTTLAKRAYSFGSRLADSSIGSNSYTFGDNNEASGAYSLAFGMHNVSDNSHSISIGRNNTSSGLNSVALGESAQASGEGSIYIGVGASGLYASGKYSVVIGQGKATGYQSVGIMGYATADYAVAIGEGVSSSARYGVGFGQGIAVSSENQVVVGKYNIIGSNYIFGIGDGTSDTSRHNALIVGAGGSFTLYSGEVVNNTERVNFEINSSGNPSFGGQTITLYTISNDPGTIFYDGSNYKLSKPLDISSGGTNSTGTSTTTGNIETYVTKSTSVNTLTGSWISWGNVIQIYLDVTFTSAISVPVSGDISNVNIGTIKTVANRPWINSAFSSTDGIPGFGLINSSGIIRLNSITPRSAAYTIAAGTHMYFYAVFLRRG